MGGDVEDNANATAILNSRPTYSVSQGVPWSRAATCQASLILASL